MTEGTWVQGDTGPDYVAILHEQDNPEAPLTNLDEASEIRFQMRKGDDRRFTVNRVAEVVDAEEGRVRYVFQPNDLATPGEYKVQFEITYADDVKQTQAIPTEITVRRK